MTDKAKDKRPYFVLTNEYPRHRKSGHYPRILLDSYHSSLTPLRAMNI